LLTYTTSTSGNWSPRDSPSESYLPGLPLRPSTATSTPASAAPAASPSPPATDCTELHRRRLVSPIPFCVFACRPSSARESHRKSDSCACHVTDKMANRNGAVRAPEPATQTDRFRDLCENVHQAGSEYSAKQLPANNNLHSASYMVRTETFNSALYI